MPRSAFTALRVITALTAQNTKGVFAIHEVPADFIAAQIDAVFSDLDIGAVKIGMLGNAAAIDAVAAGLDRHRARNVVLDPVMAATSGEKLLRADALGALRKLIAQANVLTPNLPEAAALLDVPLARDESEMRAQADKLLAFGAGAVLIKGGHAGGPESVDLLVEPAGSTRFAAPRAADRQHPRHRLHARLGDRRRPRQGLFARRGGGRGQGLCQRRHRRGGPARGRLRPRPAASFFQVVVADDLSRRRAGLLQRMRAGEGVDLRQRIDDPGEGRKRRGIDMQNISRPPPGWRGRYRPS